MVARFVIFNYCYFNRKLADEELQTNIAQYEKFTLPSGQEIEKENILLKTIFATGYRNVFDILKNIKIAPIEITKSEG